MSGNSERPIILFAGDIQPVRSPAKPKFPELVKLHMAENPGKNEKWATVAVALTPEGRAAWEEAREADLKRG